MAKGGTSAQGIDASIILNLHREAIYLRRTLISLEESICLATNSGLSIELVIVFDNSNAETQTLIDDFEFCSPLRVVKISVSNGSLGLSRNDGIKAASGDFILTADGDDLISENFIYNMLQFAKRHGHKCIYFSQYLFGFGDNYYISVYRDLKFVTPFTFVDRHPYVSRVCAHRTVFERLPYIDVRLSDGYAFEDWHFNSEAVALGIDIKAVPDTILFYRQRAGSLLRQAEASSVCQIPPSRLFEPSVFVDLCSDSASEIENPDFQGIRNNPVDRAFLGKANFKHMLSKANAIEPLIKPWLYDEATVFANTHGDVTAGLSYFSICKALGDTIFDDVYLLPFISTGGAEKYLFSIMEVIFKISPERNALVVLGEEYTGNSWVYKCPPNVTVIDLSLYASDVTIEQRCLLTLKLIQSSAEKARIHVRQSWFGDTFIDRFSPVLIGNELVYYRFSDTVGVFGKDVLIEHSPIDLIAENLKNINFIVSDNKQVLKEDMRRIGVYNEKWACVYAPIETPINSKRGTFDPSLGILWASRLDKEKRPDLISVIGQQLSKGDCLDVYGSSVLENFDVDQFDSIEGVNYCGRFDGLDSIPLGKYSIFIYTSWHDGVPNVLLEAMAAGLVVIAPDIGGISEVVINGKTGVLLPSLSYDVEMAATYVEAVKKLQKNPNETSRMIDEAYDLLEERHSPKFHAGEVSRLFRLKHEGIPLAERITFERGEMEYNSMLASEHMSRYAFASALCFGKNVLDIGCGEGYGSAFLCDHGAKSVTGIDVSEEAVNAARKRFSRTGVEFRVGDACHPEGWSQGEKYDLVICFETIEHVSEPHALLATLKTVLTPKGVVIISCPNDIIEHERGISNTYHNEIYSFEEFRNMTTQILGEASQWLLASPVSGIAILDHEESRLSKTNMTMNDALDLLGMEGSFLLPAQKSHTVQSDGASFYIGVWNAVLDPVMIAAPLSRRAYLDYWLTLQDQKARMEYLERQQSLLEKRFGEMSRSHEAERQNYLSKIKSLSRVHSDIRSDSRAHRIASMYIRMASGESIPARLLSICRATVGLLLRSVGRLLKKVRI